MGHYKYLVMLYLYNFVLFYIDDILMYYWILTEHCQHIWQVLDKLREY